MSARKPAAARLPACMHATVATAAQLRLPQARHNPRSPAAAIECINPPLLLVCCAGERAGGRKGGGGPQVPLSDQRGATTGSQDPLPQARSTAARQQQRDSGTGCGAAAAVRGCTGRRCASCATRPPHVHKLSTNNAARGRVGCAARVKRGCKAMAGARRELGGMRAAGGGRGAPARPGSRQAAPPAPPQRFVGGWKGTEAACRSLQLSWNKSDFPPGAG